MYVSYSLHVFLSCIACFSYIFFCSLVLLVLIDLTVLLLLCVCVCVCVCVCEEFDLPEGTVYPVLHRLEKAGLLTSQWSEVSGRSRRTYELTPAGRAALGEQRSAWARFRSAVDVVIGEDPWPSTP